MFPALLLLIEGRLASAMGSLAIVFGLQHILGSENGLFYLLHESYSCTYDIISLFIISLSADRFGSGFLMKSINGIKESQGYHVM